MNEPGAGDELVAEEAPLEDLGGVLAVGAGGRNVDGQVADLDGRRGGRFEGDRPVEHAAVRPVGLDDLDGSFGSAARIRDFTGLGRGLPFRAAGGDIGPSGCLVGAVACGQSQHRGPGRARAGRGHERRLERIAGVGQGRDAPLVAGEAEIALLDDDG